MKNHTISAASLTMFYNGVRAFFTAQLDYLKEIDYIEDSFGGKSLSEWYSEAR